MRKIGVLAVVLGVSLGFGTAVFAELPPGSSEVWGRMTESGLFELTVQVTSTSSEQARIHAVQFFAEPSHTPLAVVANQHVPAQVLARGQAMAPRALARVILAGAPVSLYLAPPPDTDTAIRMEYTVELPTGEIVDLLMAEGQVGGFAEFHFSVEVGQGPMMPIDRECIYCGDRLCACTSCTHWQLCCPACAWSCDGPAC